MNYCLLIDCDNFFASCEAIFHPEYKNKPLVVASGKNGIVIARSKEAKALGIPMAAASFKYKSLFIKEDVITCKTNFSLYRDISLRIRETVATFGFPTFVYSVDEMFLQIPKEQLTEKLLNDIQKKIKRWTGIDTSLGVSTTKTLAKVATKLAKKIHTRRKILIDETEINQTLKTFPVEDIWGIGRNTHKKLITYKVRSAKDLLNKNPEFLKKLLGIHGLRTCSELSGKNAYPFFQTNVDKSLQVTKTFLTEIIKISSINEIIASFITEGCEKLRRINRKAAEFTIFLQSSRFKNNRQYFTKTYTLDEPSNYTPDFLMLKEKALSQLKDGDISIKRAGIGFSFLTDSHSTQKNLFHPSNEKNPQLMEILDHINDKFGDKTLRFASSSKSFVKRPSSSAKYTTCWDDILEIQI
ncbi:MAG: Protein UmuC [Chlamydiia bacterium]|nr:Protein UmuC [Chlamydiia bacterium]